MIWPGPEMNWGARNPAYATVDHVVPQASGGTDDPANVVLACLDCNSRKGDEVWEPKYAGENWTGLPVPEVLTEATSVSLADAREYGEVARTAEPADLSTVAGIEAHMAALHREEVAIQNSLGKRFSPARRMLLSEWHRRRDELRRRLAEVLGERRSLKALRREALAKAEALRGDVSDPESAYEVMSAAHRMIRRLGERLDWQLTDEDQAVHNLVQLWMQNHAPEMAGTFGVAEAND
jgi:hypothetical protein